MSREPWDDTFPDVIVHAVWRSNVRGQLGLWDHPLYSAAKSQSDEFAAMDIIDDLARWEALDDIRTLCGGADCRIIAPAADLAESSNALAISYAHWIAHELDLSVEDRVFQAKAVSRDKSGAWFRLAHRAEFYGHIDAGCRYLVVDDVMTMGGTLADLRSFVLKNGGCVVGMSVIASDNGDDRQIRLSEATERLLEERHGPDIDALCAELFGFPAACLTEAEGRRLADCPSHDKIRENILRERDKANARGGRSRRG